MKQLKFHLALFLFYHERVLNAQWKNEVEKIIILDCEKKYAAQCLQSLKEYTAAWGLVEIAKQPVKAKWSFRKILSKIFSLRISHKKKIVDDHPYLFSPPFLGDQILPPSKHSFF
jgi:hypothetical protein